MQLEQPKEVIPLISPSLGRRHITTNTKLRGNSTAINPGGLGG